jgi:hypothetical protein
MAPVSKTEAGNTAVGSNPTSSAMGSKVRRRLTAANNGCGLKSRLPHHFAEAAVTRDSRWTMLNVVLVGPSI